jgi:hypothetical protein
MPVADKRKKAVHRFDRGEITQKETWDFRLETGDMRFET